MSELESQVKEPEDNSALAFPGQKLKSTREELRLSRDEVAHHLHLDVKVVDALEADAFDELPSPAYICGYLRSYARILKLPENDIVNAYSRGEEINAALIPENIKILPERHLNPANFKIVLITVTLIAITAGLLWAVDKFNWLNSPSPSANLVIPLSTSDEKENPVRPAQIQKQIEQFNSEHPDSMPVVETEKLGPDVITGYEDETITDFSDTLGEEEAESSTAGNRNDSITIGDLKLVFSKDSWTEVIDANGLRHVYRLVSKNNEIIINGTPPYTILLGDADGVEVIYQEKIFNHKPYQRDQIAYFRLGVAPE